MIERQSPKPTLRKNNEKLIHKFIEVPSMNLFHRDSRRLHKSKKMPERVRALFGLIFAFAKLLVVFAQSKKDPGKGSFLGENE